MNFFYIYTVNIKFPPSMEKKEKNKNTGAKSQTF